MKIQLWADLVDWPLEASVKGDILTINGEDFDFTDLPEGWQLPASAMDSPFFVEGYFAERVNGEIHVTIRLPANFGTDPAILNPAQLLVLDVKKGKVTFPNTEALENEDRLEPSAEETHPGIDPGPGESESSEGVSVLD